MSESVLLSTMLPVHAIQSMLFCGVQASHASCFGGHCLSLGFVVQFSYECRRAVPGLCQMPSVLLRIALGALGGTGTCIEAVISCANCLHIGRCVPESDEERMRQVQTWNLRMFYGRQCSSTAR